MQHIYTSSMTSIIADSPLSGLTGSSRRRLSRITEVPKTTRQVRGPSQRYSSYKRELFPGQSSIRLSAAAAHQSATLLKDMTQWVHRSSDQRLQEAQIEGRVRRPMNPFMLYKCAYCELTKNLLSEMQIKPISHQNISRVAGSSWKIELSHVRRKYEMLAKVERDNHSVAFPDYKFRPKKGPLLAKRQNDHHHSAPAEDDNFDHKTPCDNRGKLPHGNSCAEIHLPYEYSDSLSGLSGAPHFDLILPQQAYAALAYYVEGGHFDLGPTEGDYFSHKVPCYNHEIYENLCAEIRRPYDYLDSLSGLPGAPHSDLILPQQAYASPAPYTDGDRFDSQPVGYDDLPALPTSHCFASTAYDARHGEAWITEAPEALSLRPHGFPQVANAYHP